MIMKGAMPPEKHLTDPSVSMGFQKRERLLSDFLSGAYFL